MSRNRTTLTLHLIAAQATAALIAAGTPGTQFNSRIVVVASTTPVLAPTFSGRFQVPRDNDDTVVPTLRRFLELLKVTAAVEAIEVVREWNRTQVRFQLRLASVTNWSRA